MTPETFQSIFIVLLLSLLLYFSVQIIKLFLRK